MKHIIRICAIAVALSAILFLNPVATKIEPVHACSSNIVAGSTTTYIEINATMSFSLWYNSCNQQNFASANITQGSDSDLSVAVNRASGPDGPGQQQTNLNCPSTGICNSPGVYSPHNSAEAEIFLHGTFILSSYF